MKLYHGSFGGVKPIRKAREVAPSHTHGSCYTPSMVRQTEWPYFIDNGAFGGNFDADEWCELLDDIESMPYPPDFVVLPDVLNDAERTLDRHRRYASEVLDRHLRPAPVLQPGLPVRQQVALAEQLGASIVFVGGACSWQRSFGADIVEEAHERGLRVHLGNPGSKDRLLWSHRIGFDSADTTTIVTSQNWDWLEALEAQSRGGISRGALKKEPRQQTLISTDGGRNSCNVQPDTDRQEGDR